MNHQFPQNPYLPNMLVENQLQNAYIKNMLQYKNFSNKPKASAAEPGQEEEPAKKLKIEDTSEEERALTSTESKPKTVLPLPSNPDPIKCNSLRNITGYPMNLAMPGADQLSTLPHTPYMFPFPSQPPYMNFPYPPMGGCNYMGLPSGYLPPHNPLTMMAGGSLLDSLKKIPEKEEKPNSTKKKNAVSTAKHSSQVQVRTNTEQNNKRSESKKPQEKELEIVEEGDFLGKFSDCCCKCHMKVENNEDGGSSVNDKRKHHESSEESPGPHDDYHHIYSGRLRLKPGQKNYYKQIKKQAKIDGTEPQVGSPFLLERPNRQVEYVSRETQTSPMSSPRKVNETNKEIEILPKYQKRDYENYEMPLHITEETKDEIKLTPISDAYQVTLPSYVSRKPKKNKKSRELKPMWNPDEVDEMNLWDYLGSLDQYIGTEVTNEERAIKLFKKFKYSKTKVLESIRKNKGYYLTFLGIDAKQQRFDGD